MMLPQLKEGTEQVIEKFLAEKLRKVGAKGFVLGVSGGMDSALVLRLCARAVGKKKVLALLMPDGRRAMYPLPLGSCSDCFSHFPSHSSTPYDTQQIH